MLRLLIYNTECVTFSKHGRVRSETRISSSMRKCVSAFFMKLVSSGLIMACGLLQGFEVRMLMPLIHFYCVSVFYFISQSLSFYVICNWNSIEESRWEAVCRSDGQFIYLFIYLLIFFPCVRHHRVYYHADSSPPVACACPTTSDPVC
jgi:hypothetical protein